MIILLWISSNTLRRIALSWIVFMVLLNNNPILIKSIVDFNKISKMYTERICVYNKNSKYFHYIPRATQSFSSIPHPSQKEGIEITEDVKVVDMLFRWFIWEDMIEEMIKDRAWFGMGFSHPLRSRHIEAMRWVGEWEVNGWISAHNSYLYVIYRAGILGLGLIFILWYGVYKSYKIFMNMEDTTGVVLVACSCYWLTCAFTELQFELPYYAIPLWTLVGLIFNRARLINSL